MAKAATWRQQWVSAIIYYVVAQERLFPPKAAATALPTKCHSETHCPLSIGTLAPFVILPDLFYRAPWMFRNSVPCTTVATGHKISARCALSVISVLLKALLPCHFLVGYITANYKHNRTLNSKICLTGRHLSFTICMQNKA